MKILNKYLMFNNVLVNVNCLVFLLKKNCLSFLIWVMNINLGFDGMIKIYYNNVIRIYVFLCKVLNLG